MPLTKEYLHGVDTQRVPRNFSTRIAFPSDTTVRYTKWEAPLAGSATLLVTAGVGPNAASVTFARSGASPYRTLDGGSISGTTFDGTGASGVLDCPRNVVITVADGAAVVAQSGVIYGQDEYGKLISEAWSVTATGTSKVYTGKKAFAVVDGITSTAATDASGNTISVGTGNVLGLPSRNAVAGTNAGVKETIDGAIVVTGVYTKGGADPADDKGTFAPATAPNGTHIYEVWYLEVDPQL